jgi:hypothetical protein
MAKYITQTGGQLTEVAAATAGGAPDAGKIPELDGSGRLASGMMPTGIGADTAVLAASEALAAGDLVNVWNDAGTAKVRKADAATNKPAHGFVLAAFATAANATVYFEGQNAQQTGMTAGVVFLSATAGRATSTVPTTAGHIVQSVGFALSATSMNFEPGAPITLA